jgi:capsular exopolysaccharide synthesis family protein
VREPQTSLQRTDQPAERPAALQHATEFVRNSAYDSAYPGAAETSSGYNRLHEYWRSVRKHKWLVISLVIIITALAAIYMSRQPDVFETRAQVQVDTEIANNPGLGAMRGNEIVFNYNYQDPVYFNTQLQILTSAALLTRVAKNLDLEHNPDFLHPRDSGHSLVTTVKNLVGAGKSPSSTDPPPRTDEQSNLALQTNAAVTPADAERLLPYVETLQGGLTVKQLNETRVIQIFFKHQDPEISRKVSNMIADTFVLNNLERRTVNSNTAGDFLQKRIAELQSEIRQGEEQLINYAKNHQILSLDANQNTVVDRLAGLNKQLLDAENERKAAEAAYRAGTTPGALSAQAETATKNTVAETEAKVAELKQKRAQLLLDYTEKYPEVKDIDQQIAALEKTAKDLRTHNETVVKTNLETQYKQALQKEQALRDAFEKQRAETITQNEAAVNYKIFQQEIETNKTLLDGLLQRAKENDVILAGTPNNIHVLDYAAKPKFPVAPKRKQMVAVAALLALILGIALARYLDYLDDSIGTSEEVESFLRLPALAVIPALGGATSRRLLSAMPSHKKNGRKGGDELLLHGSQRSPLAEAYRQLRTSVLLSSPGGAPKTLLVTSSQPGEGKTTTVVNTGMILAQTGARVLLVDADMRRPRLHSIFGVDNSSGLSTILATKPTEAEILSFIQQHEESGLFLLPSGSIPPNPAELLGSDQVRGLIGVLENNFTHVIIDSPPVASFTDGVLLSSLADGVILVVHGGSASRNVVKRARQLLTEVGAKIFGVVLNNVSVRRQDYYYYKYQSYYSGSDSENGNGEATSAANALSIKG